MKRTINTLPLFRPLVWRLAILSLEICHFLREYMSSQFSLPAETLAPRYTLHKSITPISIEIDPQEFGKSPIEPASLPLLSRFLQLSTFSYMAEITWRFKLRPFLLKHPPV